MTEQAGNDPREGKTGGIRKYWRLVLLHVLQPFLIDLFVILVIAATLWGLARLLLLTAPSHFSLTSDHVDQAGFLLGLLYLVAMAITATRRLYFGICSVRTPASSSNDPDAEA